MWEYWGELLWEAVRLAWGVVPGQPLYSALVWFLLTGLSAWLLRRWKGHQIMKEHLHVVWVGLCAGALIFGGFFLWNLLHLPFNKYQTTEQELDTSRKSIQQLQQLLSLERKRNEELSREAANKPVEIHIPPIRVEQATEWRISNEDKQKLASFLIGFPVGKIGISSEWKNPDSYRYSVDLQEAILRGGWQVEDAGIGRVSATPPFKGVKIHGKTDRSLNQPTTRILREALIQIGIAPIQELDPSLPDEVIVLRVGHRTN